MVTAIKPQVPVEVLTSGAIAGNGFHSRTQMVCILSKVVVGTLTVVIVAAKKRMS